MMNHTKNPFNIQSFGLDSDNIPRNARARNAAGGFVVAGESDEYAANGYQPSSADELFANDQGDKPWSVLFVVKANFTLNQCQCQSNLM